jgi:hypothetical protein
MRMPLAQVGTATIVAVVALLAILLPGCGGGGDRAEPATSPAVTTETSTPANGSLTDLVSVEQFAALFNQKEGVPRLVLLLSPT